jgi:hypothetical protein
LYTNNSKMPDIEMWHSCCKWPMCLMKTPKTLQ